jgi:hypothetical protein
VVFSPWRAEPSFAMPWRVAHGLASPLLVCCQATSINTWMTQEWGGVTWPCQQWRHAFPQWRNNWRTVGRSVSPVSQQGYRKDWSSFTRVLGGRQTQEVRELRVVSSHPVKT